MKFPLYPKINSIQKRHKEGPLKGQFTGEWAIPEFAYLADNEWVWREKIDGTNIRIHLTCDASGWPEVEFGGRTDNAQLPAPLVMVLNQLFNTDDAKDRIRETFGFDSLSQGVVLFGEGYGEGIQKGGVYGPVDFILFDVMVGGWWLFENSVTDIAENLQINRVPVIGSGTLRDAIQIVQWKALKSEWPGVEPEGIVAVPTVPLFDRKGHRIMAKIKGVDFP